MDFPSRRRVTLTVGGEAETLAVSRADGRVELTVRFTDDGLRLSFGAARVELDDVGELSVDCARFAVRSEGEIELSSGANVRVRSERNICLDGENLLLNCGDGFAPNPNKDS